MNPYARFLFQGDSITDAGRGRTDDPNHILGHSYAFLIGSRLSADFPERGLTFINRGVGGDSHVELENRWSKDTLEQNPDVLSLLIGTNGSRQYAGIKRPWDTDAEWLSRQTPQAYEDTLRRMLCAARKHNPELLIVLCRPFRFPGSQFTQEENLKITAAVRERAEIVHTLASEFDAVSVDFQSALERAVSRNGSISYWCWDGCHVTVAGHEILARAWMKAVSPHIDFLKDYRYALMEEK